MGNAELTDGGRIDTYQQQSCVSTLSPNFSAERRVGTGLCSSGEALKLSGVKVQNLSGKLTIVTVAHRLSTVTGCDKLVDLSNEAAVAAETVT